MNGALQPSCPSLFFGLLLLAAALLLAACAGTPSPALPLSPSPTLAPSPTPTATPALTPAVLTAARLAGLLPALPAAEEPAVHCAGMAEADAALTALCLAVARNPLADLPLASVSLERLPGGAEGYPLAAGRPAGLISRRGTALSPVGWMRGGKGDGRVVVAVREERAGEPVVFLAAVDPAELAGVLAANGYEVVMDGEGYRLRGPALSAGEVALAAIPAEDPLYAQLEAAMGVVFFDKAVGADSKETFVTNPLVPRPPTELMPEGTAVTYHARHLALGRSRW